MGTLAERLRAEIDTLWEDSPGMDGEKVRAFANEAERLEARLDMAIGLLQKHQFRGHNHVCLECRQTPLKGHYPSCCLAALVSARPAGEGEPTQ